MKYIVQRFLFIRERDFIRQLFNVLDEEKDGELEPEEMQNAFLSLFQLELSPTKWSLVIKNVDFQQDGNIQFTEFLVAASRKQLLFSNENL
jgi:Ca2+-binding EF-hand superfamily protein